MSEISNTSTTLFAREVKVRTLQYKFTVFIIALGLFVAWPFLTDLLSRYQTIQDVNKTLAQEIEIKNTQRQEIIQDISLLQQVGSGAEKNSILQCYNTNCSNLPEALRNEPQKSVFKAFLQLQQPTQTKFVIDQKKILAYLNEFLIRSADGNTVNGQIKAISFGTTQNIQATKLIRVPMSVTMIFPNKQGLLGFLRNIEQLVSPTIPMLGVVQSVTYDIVKTDVAQDVIVIIDIYMLEQ